MIGLTGGIGVGKSTVAGILADLGAIVIDADRIGHAAYAVGTEGWRRVVEVFGREIVAADGTIDRKRLGAIVFADSGRLAELNRIVHPFIGERVKAEVDAALAAEPPAVVIEAALLIEAKWFALVDEVWLVVAGADVVEKRLAAQRGLDPAAVRARMGAQSSDEERRRHATVVIENSDSVQDLRRRVGRLWQQRIQTTAGR